MCISICPQRLFIFPLVNTLQNVSGLEYTATHDTHFEYELWVFELYSGNAGMSRRHRVYHFCPLFRQKDFRRSKFWQSAFVFDHNWKMYE